MAVLALGGRGRKNAKATPVISGGFLPMPFERSEEVLQVGRLILAGPIGVRQIVYHAGQGKASHRLPSVPPAIPPVESPTCVPGSVRIQYRV